jgi:DNA replication protein DnaC
VLFTTAVDIINTLAAAQSAGRLKREFLRYLKPAVLIVDELGYLPIDKHGADLLFQIIRAAASCLPRRYINGLAREAHPVFICLPIR